MPWLPLLLTAGCALDAPPELDVESQALGCFAVRQGDTWLAASGDSFGFTATTAGVATPLFFQPSDLGTYLLYDPDGGYVVAESGPLTRETVLSSDVSRVDDGYVSGAEWLLQASWAEHGLYQLRSRRHDTLLSADGLTPELRDAAALTLEPADGCREHPELSLDATGVPTRTTFDDGDLYGIVDTHSHILSNFGFGGGLFHGGAFHRLGVEHALGDCETYHGVNGRQDFFGYAFDSSGSDSSDMADMLPDLVAGELSEDAHVTAGYPEFTDWPNARKRSTHQAQYFRWLERAWLAGLRLVVQHATSNSVICNVTVGEGYQPARYDCEDMTAIDRIVSETWQMARYIDARSGGEGQGWFRVVETPAQAREVIAAGKLAVVLGIEVSDLFDCHLTPREGGPVCDDAHVIEQLDSYQARGVRAIFPVHKYDNAFSPGDGAGGFIELGNFLNSGHWTNMAEDCPDTPAGDGGGVTFGGLLQARDEYLSPAPNDMSQLPYEPLLTIVPYYYYIDQGSLDGDWCQNAGLTSVGETLILEMMKRGMILEVDHLPAWSYQRAFELLEQHAYPGVAGTHGRNWDGRLYALGGVSKSGLGTCQDPNDPGKTLRSWQDRIALIEASGGYPAEGFGFDFNGFAGARGPRFGDEGCGDDQPNPIVYPFDSYAGDVTFTAPHVGERAIDFDTEGMVHVGLLPELLQDARSDAISDDDLEPLFRSAEGYVRMWEAAESRGAELRGE
jgi:microsomal dipeptidase-like Zn-dependent dipeptidase